MEKIKSAKKVFWTGYKPFSPTDIANQIHAARGSYQTAKDCQYSNFNGHSIHCDWNEYRQYYVVEYFWAGRVVLCRSSDFLEALNFALKYHEEKNGASGTLTIHPNENDLDKIPSTLKEFSPESCNQEYESMITPEHEKMRLQAFKEVRGI